MYLTCISASIFGEIFLRPAPNTLTRSLSTPAGKAKAKKEEMKRRAFVTHFLTDEYDEIMKWNVHVGHR